MLEWKEDNGIGVLTLSHGKASALDLEFLDAIDSAFRDAEKYDAVVVTGDGKIFSAGVDLFRLTNDGSEYVDRFLPSLDRAFLSILRCSRPVVAAVNGHAIAGGCLIALAADRALMATGGGRIGVPELRVGVPFPALAAQILESMAAPAVACRLALSGDTISAEKALELGLIDEVTSVEDLMPRSLAVARDLLSIPRDTFALTKKRWNEALIARAEEESKTFGAETLAIWRSPATHQTIRDYLARTVEKK